MTITWVSIVYGVPISITDDAYYEMDSKDTSTYSKKINKEIKKLKELKKLLKNTGFDIMHLPHDFAEYNELPRGFVGITLVESEFGECKKDLYDYLLKGRPFPDDATRDMLEQALSNCDINYSKDKLKVYVLPNDCSCCS